MNYFFLNVTNYQPKQVNKLTLKKSNENGFVETIIFILI